MNTAPGSSHTRSTRMVAVLRLLDMHRQLPLAVLAEELNASEATIRRDVAVLASQGLLVRTHGGARTSQGRHEIPERLRSGINERPKSRIAIAAAMTIPQGRQTIGLTGGTTTARVLGALAERDDLTIITNSLSIGMDAAEQRQARVLIVGGVLRSDSRELVGPLAEATLRLVSMSTAIVGADGVSSVGGVTTHDDNEARTNHTMIERAERVVVVADSSKISRITLSTVCDLCEVDLLITDSNAPAAEVSRIREAGVEVLVVRV